jgi:arsenate reductase
VAGLASTASSYQFHDFKKQGVPPEQLARWAQAPAGKTAQPQGHNLAQAGRGAQAGVQDSASAQALMLANPSVIKRPVVDWGKGITVGFDAAAWAARV